MSKPFLLFFFRLTQEFLSKTVYDAKRPYLAPVRSRELFSEDSDRHCLHVEIDISDCPDLKYQAGDHVAIWPTNSDTEVQRLADVLGLSDKLDTVVMVKAVDAAASKKYPFPVPSTYRAIFRHYLDICAPVSRQTLMSLVEYAPTEESKACLERLAKDKEAYRHDVGDAVRNLAEVLALAATVDGADKTTAGFFSSVPFDLIVESTSRLQPRYYSISSTPLIDPTKISATAVTLSYQPTPGDDRTVYGVATNYLYQIHATAAQIVRSSTEPCYDLAGPRNALGGTKVPVHVRKSQFRLPRNAKKPVIMVGPGTGVAPFRGFVHERAILKQKGEDVGPTILFYGCRHPAQDYLYADEWPGLFETLGGESRIITAFSRETDQKVYVQHRLREQGEDIWRLIDKEGAYIYICGDAKNMARDVQHAFVEFAMRYGGKSEEAAHDVIKKLRNTGRYQEDVWS